MRVFFVASLAYLAAALAAVLVSFDDAPAMVGSGLRVAAMEMSRWAGLSVMLTPVALAAAAFLGVQAFRLRLAQGMFALLACVQLQIAFTYVKSCIPRIVPFYADGWLADLDRALHGGHDPWTVVHAAIPAGWAMALLPFYLEIWALVAAGLPIIVALTDSDLSRSRRFVILYLACWVGLGNVLAVALSSVGPVFYDSVFGGNRFAGLSLALADSGINGTLVGEIQDYLLDSYLTGQLNPWSGISAFPSVHLGVATVTALYMAERRRWLAWPGAAFVLIVLVLSVYTGYHYAIDGYASILLIVAGWWVLRRSAPRAAGGANGPESGGPRLPDPVP